MPLKCAGSGGRGVLQTYCPESIHTKLYRDRYRAKVRILVYIFVGKTKNRKRLNQSRTNSKQKSITIKRYSRAVEL